METALPPSPCDLSLPPYNEVCACASRDCGRHACLIYLLFLLFFFLPLWLRSGAVTCVRHSRTHPRFGCSCFSCSVSAAQVVRACVRACVSCCVSLRVCVCASLLVSLPLLRSPLSRIELALFQCGQPPCAVTGLHRGPYPCSVEAFRVSLRVRVCLWVCVCRCVGVCMSQLRTTWQSKQQEQQERVARALCAFLVVARVSPACGALGMHRHTRLGRHGTPRCRRKRKKSEP